VKAKEEVRKEHNIIIEAKLVRVLKRAKESMNLEALGRESGYSNDTVELAIKRLVSKSLAEEDGKGGYQYLA
jgi:DNA-binding IclR family transcriptional regulator